MSQRVKDKTQEEGRDVTENEDETKNGERKETEREKREERQTRANEREIERKKWWQERAGKSERL